MSRVRHIAGHTWHGRKGAVRNAFRYSIDYVLLDAEAQVAAPLLFGRNARGLASVHDIDHGGAPHHGIGAAWVRQVLKQYRLPEPAQVELLAQPRFLGHVFNPVSFWLCRDDQGNLRQVISEVSNTFGDRHSYLCHKADGSVIEASDTLTAAKIFHVSPFQQVDGGYEFRFDLRSDRIDIRIDMTGGDGGVVATLAGPIRDLTNSGLLAALLFRPLGSRRVLALIHWQAFKLWWKGAVYHPRPDPPEQEVSK